MMTLTTLLTFSHEQIERRKKIVLLTFMVFAALC